MQSSVTALYEDHLGLLWIGTTIGLDSFTGSGKFTHYLDVGEQVAVIYEDKAGKLWIGTEGSGLFRYDRENGQFTHFMHNPEDPHSLSDNDVISIYEDNDGTLWFGTAYGGLNAIDRDTDSFQFYVNDPVDPYSLSYDRVTSIFEDLSGTLWVGTGSDYDTETGGLNALDRSTGRFTRYLHDENDPHTLSSNNITTIHQERAGLLWIGTDDGLNIFDSTTGSFDRYQHNPIDITSLGEGVINTIYEDRTGTLWLGMDGSGISYYSSIKEKFNNYQPIPLDPNSLSGPAISAILVDHTGILWVGVANEGLDGLNRVTRQIVHYSYDPDDPQSLSNNNVRALYEEHENVLWVGTNQGLDRFSPDEGTFIHYVHDPEDPNSLSPGSVKYILEDQNHSLWIATEEPGNLNRFDRDTGTFTRYEYNPDKPDGFINTYGVRALHEGRSGDLWLGTYTGLVHFDRETEVFTQYRYDPENPHGLSNNFVWSIQEDESGNLWVATDEGLNRFDPVTEHFTVYTVEDGLPSDKVVCMLADEQGILWMGTSGGGLSRFDRRTELFTNYDVSDGLVSNEMLIGACHQSQNGEMFFGTNNGFNAFYPDDIKGNPYVPPVHLTAFRKFDEVVEFDVPLSEVEEITLAYKENFFAFEFAALDYLDPAKNQYAYQLEGFDEDWIYCGTRRYASYTNLPPGEYIFHVKGTNNDGLWNETGHTVRIKITPPYWQTWWFMIIVVALALVVMTAVIGTRMRHIAVLRESEERFRTLFENAPLCIFELDMTLTPPRIIRANRKSTSVYGWSPPEFTASSLDQIFTLDARPDMERMVNALNPGETLTVESTGLRANGMTFPIRVSATGEAGHGLRHAILAVEDITAEKGRRSEEEAIIEERRRIARDIHDGLAQDLAGLRFEVELWHQLVDKEPKKMHTELNKLQKLLSKNIREVRRSIFALRPVALEKLGFYPALHQFVEEYAEQNQLHVDLHIEGRQERLPASLEPVLFRIIQEALNNISKHAQANAVWIALNLESSESVKLSVRDNGVGFNPASLSQLFKRGHLGLRQMQERIVNLNGTFELNTKPGKGTEIAVTVPLLGKLSEQSSSSAIHSEEKNND